MPTEETRKRNRRFLYKETLLIRTADTLSCLPGATPSAVCRDPAARGSTDSPLLSCSEAQGRRNSSFDSGGTRPVDLSTMGVPHTLGATAAVGETDDPKVLES